MDVNSNTLKLNVTVFNFPTCLPLLVVSHAVVHYQFGLGTTDTVEKLVQSCFQNLVLYLYLDLMNGPK